MKTIALNLYVRGKAGSIYLRRRIPQALKSAYPAKKTHMTVCLHTSDLRVAKVLQRQEEVRIDAEFSQRLEELKKKQADRATKRVEKMSDEVLKSLADHWVRQVLETDEHYRELDSEEEFEEKGSNMTEQRAELGRMLAMRRSDKILPAMHSFIHLCGLDVDMSPEESKRAGSVFLTAVCTALDFQLQRQRGEVVQTDRVSPATPAPRELVAAQTASESKKLAGMKHLIFGVTMSPVDPRAPQLPRKRLIWNSNASLPRTAFNALKRSRLT
jgi:Skp family chaperone for outer membrane proteins